MPATSPRAASRPPACSPSLTKNLLPPPSSPLKKQGKARWIHTKTRIFARSKTGARQSPSPPNREDSKLSTSQIKGKAYMMQWPLGDESHLYRPQLSHVSSTRPERAEAPSPGHRPGLLRTQTCRPVRAKALKNPGNI